MMRNRPFTHFFRAFCTAIENAQWCVSEHSSAAVDQSLTLHSLGRNSRRHSCSTPPPPTGTALALTLIMSSLNARLAALTVNDDRQPLQASG